MGGGGGLGRGGGGRTLATCSVCVCVCALSVWRGSLTQAHAPPLTPPPTPQVLAQLKPEPSAFAAIEVPHAGEIDHQIDHSRLAA